MNYCGWDLYLLIKVKRIARPFDAFWASRFLVPWSLGLGYIRVCDMVWAWGWFGRLGFSHAQPSVCLFCVVLRGMGNSDGWLGVDWENRGDGVKLLLYVCTDKVWIIHSTVCWWNLMWYGSGRGGDINILYLLLDLHASGYASQHSSLNKKQLQVDVNIIFAGAVCMYILHNLQCLWSPDKQNLIFDQSHLT